MPRCKTMRRRRSPAAHGERGGSRGEIIAMMPAPDASRSGRFLDLADMRRLSCVRRHNTLLEDEATIEAPLARLDHAIGFPGELVEGKPLDRSHGKRASFRGSDCRLDLL